MLANNYEKDLVSVICLGYKHVNFLKENITAIWENDYRSIEIIVLDDGSNDGSVELLEALALESPFPMKVLSQKNTGNVAANFNKALGEARGEFVTIMSLDDVLAKDAISSKMAVMSKKATIAFIFNDEIIRIDNESKIINIVTPFNILAMKEITADTLLEKEYTSFGTYYIQGTLYRHDVVDAVGCFDNDLLGDDIVLRCKCYNFIKENPEYKFRVFPKSACFVRSHAENINKNYIRQIKLVVEVLDRYFPNKETPPQLYTWVKSAKARASHEEMEELYKYSNRLLALRDKF